MRYDVVPHLNSMTCCNNCQDKESKAAHVHVKCNRQICCVAFLLLWND